MKSFQPLQVIEDLEGQPLYVLVPLPYYDVLSKAVSKLKRLKAQLTGNKIKRLKAKSNQDKDFT